MDYLLFWQLGFPPAGTTGYYSANAHKADAEVVQTFLDAKNISGYSHTHTLLNFHMTLVASSVRIYKARGRRWQCLLDAPSSLH